MFYAQACFALAFGMNAVSPQGQMHPGQQKKRTESQFLLQFEITFMIQATTAGQNPIFIAVCSFLLFRDPHLISFCNGLEQTVVSELLNYNLCCVWELVTDFSWPAAVWMMFGYSPSYSAFSLVVTQRKW